MKRIVEPADGKDSHEQWRQVRQLDFAVRLKTASVVQRTHERSDRSCV
jgi:hypothetical protein